MKKMSPNAFKRLLNWYPPYIGAGVKVQRISANWQEMDVTMTLRFYNRNAVGTHFGGSLYSMVDPHYVLLLMQLLGRDYIVWDKAAEIEFVKPGKGTVTAQIVITDAQLDAIKAAVTGGDKHFPVFELAITDAAGDVVANIKKTLYVCKK